MSSWRFSKAPNYYPNSYSYEPELKRFDKKYVRSLNHRKFMNYNTRKLIKWGFICSDSFGLKNRSVYPSGTNWLHYEGLNGHPWSFRLKTCQISGSPKIDRLSTHKSVKWGFTCSEARLNLSGPVCPSGPIKYTSKFHITKNSWNIAHKIGKIWIYLLWTRLNLKMGRFARPNQLTPLLRS